MEVFENDCVTIITWFPWPSIPQAQIQNAFLNSSGLVWTENIWCVLRVKPPFLNSSGVVWTRLLIWLLAYVFHLCAILVHCYLFSFPSLWQLMQNNFEVTFETSHHNCRTNLLLYPSFIMIFNDLFPTFPFPAGSNQRQRGGIYSRIHWKLLRGWYLHGLRDIDNYNPSNLFARMGLV